MNPPEIGKLYRTTKQYMFRKDQDLNFSTNSTCKLIDEGLVFFLARVIERRSTERNRILWLYHIIYGEQIGYVFTFDRDWTNEMTLVLDPNEC